MTTWRNHIALLNTKHGYNVHVLTHAMPKLGRFEKMDDGYYSWLFPSEIMGDIPSRILRALADALDDLNEEWDKKVQEIS